MLAVTCADFNLRLSVWSLQDKSYVHISSPKFPAAGVSFSPDGRVMAVGHRKQCKDSGGWAGWAGLFMQGLGWVSISNPGC